MGACAGSPSPACASNRSEPVQEELTLEQKKEIVRVKELTTIVKKKYFTKVGHDRRIVHLWGNFFRINYYNYENFNIIDESHFIEVVKGEVVEYTGEPKKAHSIFKGE